MDMDKSSGNKDQNKRNINDNKQRTGMQQKTNTVLEGDSKK